MAFNDGVKTVSGSIAHTDDAATKVPFVSVKCGIEPTLTGKSEVVCTQTGKNLLDTAISETKTNNSVSITCDGNGKYTATGTATGGSANITFTLETPCKIKSGMYFHAMNSVANGNTSITLQRQDNSTIMYFSLSPTNRIVDLSSYAGETVYSIRFYVVNGAPFEMSLTPMVCFSSTATSYEPYTAPTQYTASLGRTIHGGQVDIVNGEGTENCKKIALGDLTWIKSGTEGNFYCSQVTDIWYPSEGGISRYGIGVSDEFEFVQGTPQNGQINCYFNTAYSGYRIFIKKEDYADRTSAEFKEYLQSIDAHLVYKVNEATETDFTFTPITPTPESVGKVNNVYCNTGDTELTYHDNAHGFSEVTVNRCGKNLWSSDKDLSITRDKTIYMRIPRGTYTLSFDFVSSTASPVPSYMQVAYSTTDGTKYNPVTVVEGRCSRTFTLSADARNLTIYSSTSYSASVGVTTVVNNIQLEVGSQASSYEPYEAVSKTAYLHKVIYGGQADVVRGICEPKNLLKNLGTFPYTGSFTSTYYVEFANNLQGKKIPLFALQNNVTYILSADVECSLEPFNLTIGVGNGRYLRDIANGSAQYTSGRVYLKFTPTNLTEGNNYLAFRVPRYGTTKGFEVTISNVQLEIGDTASDFAPYFEPFSFQPISMETDEGENTLFANEGDSAITYRKAVD